MKSHEYTTNNIENAEQAENEKKPWESVAEVPFAGGVNEDGNLDRVRASMVLDETATEEEQRAMEETQETADKNGSAESPKGKDFENYVDNILNRKE